jgi:probable HAF family extracellular repeat protein
MNDLGVLQPGGHSNALAINAIGQITGTEGLSIPNLPLINHAFIYENGVMTSLGAPVNDDTVGKAINTWGQIVGQSLKGNGGWSTFLYTPKSGFLDLNSLLLSPSGWVLTDAIAINDAGQILGSGTYLAGC